MKGHNEHYLGWVVNDYCSPSLQKRFLDLELTVTRIPDCGIQCMMGTIWGHKCI